MVLSRDQLLERVWGYEYLGDSRLVDAHVRRLRVKIEDQPDEPEADRHRPRHRLPPAAVTDRQPEQPAAAKVLAEAFGLRIERGARGDALAEVADDHEVDGQQVGQLVALDDQAGSLGNQATDGVGREVLASQA